VYTPMADLTGLVFRLRQNSRVEMIIRTEAEAKPSRSRSRDGQRKLSIDIHEEKQIYSYSRVQEVGVWPLLLTGRHEMYRVHGKKQ